MKKTFGKENSEKFWRNEVIVLLLFIIAAFVPIGISAQTLPCDLSQYLAVTRVGVEFPIPPSNGGSSYARYDILRNGLADHYVFIQSQEPANSVFKAHLNGVELATLQVRLPNTPFQFWFWEVMGNNIPVGRVGDVISITKNAQPFISGTYTRPTYDYEATWGFGEGAQPPLPNGLGCDWIQAKTYLPNSATPRRFEIEIGDVHAPAAITKVSLNEPSNQPGVPGTQVRNYQFSNVASPTFPGWFIGTISETNAFTLNENQYNLMRQGLLSIIVYTAAHPNGFVHIPLTTQGINSSGDFEGDGIADLAVFRPSEQNWYVQFSSNNQTQTINFGLPNDKLVASDYDGDGKADIAVFQTQNPNYPGKGIWQILQSSDNSRQTIHWGSPGDVPLSLDIDANNTRDLGVFRPTSGTWYIHRMGDIIKPFAEFGGETDLVIQWGIAGDKPLTGDFNGDRVDELVAFRPSEGNWYIYNYLNGGYQVVRWGLSSDIPMAKDFDGDRKVDLAVYRPSEGTWYIRSSIDNSIIIRRFGLSEDIPVPADFDKDGVTDIAVFRPSNGTWYVTRSSDNSFFATQFGLNGDIPAFAQR